MELAGCAWGTQCGLVAQLHFLLLSVSIYVQHPRGTLAYNTSPHLPETKLTPSVMMVSASLKL